MLRAWRRSSKCLFSVVLFGPIGDDIEPTIIGTCRPNNLSLPCRPNNLSLVCLYLSLYIYFLLFVHFFS
jgi:hypothetical protein